MVGLRDCFRTFPPFLDFGLLGSVRSKFGFSDDLDLVTGLLEFLEDKILFNGDIDLVTGLPELLRGLPVVLTCFRDGSSFIFTSSALCTFCMPSGAKASGVSSAHVTNFLFTEGRFGGIVTTEYTCMPCASEQV